MVTIPLSAPPVLGAFMIRAMSPGLQDQNMSRPSPFSRSTPHTRSAEANSPGAVLKMARAGRPTYLDDSADSRDSVDISSPSRRTFA